MRMINNSWRHPATLAVISVLMLVLLVMCGCTTTRYVPTVSVQYRQRVDSVRDSVYLRDSVVIERYRQGDTCYKYVTRWRVDYRNRYKLMRDTVDVRDTVTIVRSVDKPLTKWQKIRIGVGNVAIIGIVFVFIFFIVRVVVRR